MRAKSVSIRRLEHAPDNGLDGPTTPATRLALVETLTTEAYALAGRAVATHPRHQAQVVVRPLRASLPTTPR